MAKSLLKSTSTVSLMTLFSRILGFARDVILAQSLGVFAGFDAFLVAFKIPNFMRRLFAEGAFSQAFIPVLADYRENRSEEQTQQFIDHVAGNLASALLLVTAVAMLAAPLIVMIFAPGFLSDSHRFQLATQLLRVTFPYLFLISLTALSGALLNSSGHFAVPAITPIWLNVSMIVAALVLAPYLSAHATVAAGRGYYGVLALSWAIPVAGALQLGFQLPFLWRARLLPRLRWGWHEPGTRRVMKLMLAALMGVSVSQIGTLIDTLFASFLATGSISWLYFADRLTNFPLGVFGVAIATVILPHLSRQSAARSWGCFSKGLDWAMRLILLVGVPATLGILLLAHPIFATLFQYGKFTVYDVHMASMSLITFGLGIPAFMLVKVLATGFYARQNIKTPVKVGMLALSVNIGLNFLLIGPLAHAGLALATSCAAYVNVGVLLWLLLKEKHYMPQPGWMTFGLRSLLANGVMAGFLLLENPSFDRWLQWDWHARVWHMALLIVLAVLLYFGALWLSGLRFSDVMLTDETAARFA